MGALTFDNNETGFLDWMAANPDGFVANRDRRGTSKYYPMAHRASCKALHTRDNYTTNDYYKVCAYTVADLAQWAATDSHRKLRHCKLCRPE